MKPDDDVKGPHLFSADRPIADVSSDLLGRGPFAAALAQSIASWRGQDSLVVALHGPYGSGKTSVKNLVVEQLRSTAGPSAEVVEFNPWQFAAQATIIESFFDEVGHALGKGSLATGKDRKRLLRWWERYAAYVKGTVGILDSLRKPLTLLLSAATVFLVLAAYARIFVWIFIAVNILSLVLLWTSDLFAHIVDVVRARSAQSDTTLEDAKCTLAESAAKLKSPLVIVLDDLDRLTPAQLLEVFQLVRANGDFPNFVYFLLFDRILIAKHVSEVLKVDGQEYVEKIVQVGFDLPQAATDNIQDVLFSRLNAILEQFIDWSRFDQNRWGNVFYGRLQNHFANLRDVNRFASSLSFHFEGFRSKDVFEVNPIDLIVLEATRTFAPHLYNALPSAKRVLTRTRSADAPQRASDRAILENLLSAEPENERDWKRELLGQIFPNVKWALERDNYHSSGDLDSWVRELRACAVSMFDRYFGFAIPEGELSQSDIERLLSSASDRDLIRQHLNELSEAGLLDAALNRLAAYRQKLPVESTVPFLTALCDVGDRLNPGAGGSGFDSPQVRGYVIAHGYLNADSDVKRRTDHLRRAIENTSGVTLPAVMIMHEEQLLTQGSTAEMTVDASDLQELKGICARKIATAGEDGRLLRLPGAALLLLRWQQWGSSEELGSFMQSQLSQRKNVLAFLSVFINPKFSSEGGGDIARRKGYIDLSDIEHFVSLEQINAVLQNPEPEELSQVERDALLLFRKAEQRRAQGKPDRWSPLELAFES